MVAVCTYVLWCLRFPLLFGSVFASKANVDKANQDSSLQPGNSSHVGILLCLHCQCRLTRSMSELASHVNIDRS
jgi:hypothetical protein